MSKMEELTAKYANKVIDPFKLMKADTVNHKPDIFCIGLKHVAYASDHCGGMLGKEAMEAIPCDSCHEPHSKHTHDTVLVLQLIRHCTGKEATEALRPLEDDLTADGIDGFVLIETPEKYRVEPETKEEPEDDS